MQNVNISTLLGKTFIHIERCEEDTMLKFFTKDCVFEFYHPYGCCEDVSIEDVVGDFEDLIGTPLLVAEESTSEDSTIETRHENNRQEEVQWTFYKFATIKGWVDIRWFGTSNGYYSMDVVLQERAYNDKEIEANIKKERAVLIEDIGASSQESQIKSSATILKI